MSPTRGKLSWIIQGCIDYFVGSVVAFDLHKVEAMKPRYTVGIAG